MSGDHSTPTNLVLSKRSANYTENEYVNVTTDLITALEQKTDIFYKKIRKEYVE